MKQWVSCCRGRRSGCPEVAQSTDGKVCIRDDYGNEVELLLENALMLRDLPTTTEISIYGNGPVPVRLTPEQLEDVITELEEL